MSERGKRDSDAHGRDARGSDANGRDASHRNPGHRDAEIQRLWRHRPRSRFAAWSGVALAGLAAFAWFSGSINFGPTPRERLLRNVDRFLTVDIRPDPLRGKEWDWGVATTWATDVFAEHDGAHAVLGTLALSVAAIVLAGLLALLSSLGAARTLATPEPYLPGPHAPSTSSRLRWRGVVWTTRSLLILVRAVPEYVWAFVLLTLLGLSAWPAVLALALHNAGILGKLFAEVIENRDPRTPRALRALGATRLQISASALWPESLNRFLLFFFYRWETCVREATVLGLLGFGGLGLRILDAQGAQKWDVMLLWVLMGSALILAGDIVSALARGLIRRAR